MANQWPEFKEGENGRHRWFFWADFVYRENGMPRLGKKLMAQGPPYGFDTKAQAIEAFWNLAAILRIKVNVLEKAMNPPWWKFWRRG